MYFLIGSSNIGDFKSIAFEILISIIIGIIINIIYRKTYKGVAISNNFANTLTCLTIVSYFIIRCVTNNTLLSLGMIGALSIVRFRNSVKDSSDIMFAFWAIAEGIIIGAQDYFLSFMFVIAMTFVVILLYAITTKKSKKMILIIKYDSKVNIEKIEEILNNNFPKYYLKQQSIAEENELIVEVKCNNEKIINLENLRIEGVTEISMVDYLEPTI